MRISISVPDETIKRVDAAARALGLSPGEFFARAAEHWLDDLDDERTMAAIDAALADASQDTEFVNSAAARLESE